MLKNINQVLNIVMGSFIGVFLGYSIFRFYDFKTHLESYAVQSAPWYTSILLYGAATIVIVTITLIIKYVIQKKMN